MEQHRLLLACHGGRAICCVETGGTMDGGHKATAVRSITRCLIPTNVMPAKAGTQSSIGSECDAETCRACNGVSASSPNVRTVDWVPAFAGMTKENGNARTSHHARNCREALAPQNILFA